MSAGPVDERTLRNLEFEQVLAGIEQRAASESGRERVRGIRPASDLERIERRRAIARDMASLQEAGSGRGRATLPADFDLSFLDDMETAFQRLERGGVLEGPQILLVSRLATPALALIRLASGDPDGLAGLRSLIAERGLDGASAVRDLEEIELEVSSALDEEGRVRDAASPELRRLRRRARDLRGRLAGRAKRLVDRHRDHLQDDFYTLRDDRYVLPVRSDSRPAVKGIIHGTSNSGQTLFIEPDVLVDDCNELKVLEGEVQACEWAVLADLSSLLAGHVGRLRLLHGLLAVVDEAMAVARFALDTGASWPELASEPRLDLRGLAHPALVLAGKQVVANDLELSAGRGWVVSGPNAGGKTVLLKSVGLAAIMAWAGLPVTAGGGSVVGRFARVRAEIGDAQSIEGDLSTFSAQVTNLARILEDAGRGSLVILDELAAGTDPDEGAALAEALALEIVERGAALVVATHFEALKQLSMASDVLEAAGMGLDLDSLEPTFRLRCGVPGSSGGLLVAERFGLPARVVNRARDLLSKGRGPGETRLEALERLQGDLEERRREADRQERDLRKKEVQLKARERDVVDGRLRRLRSQEQYLETELRVLRAELRHAHKVLRRRPVDDGTLERSEKLASRVSRVLAPGGTMARIKGDVPDAQPLERTPPAPGDTVSVPRLGLEGVVEEVDGSRVRIRHRGVAWTVRLDDLSAPASAPDGEQGEKAMDEEKERPPDGGGDDEGFQTPYNTLDLRGSGLDEAKIDLDGFIDEAIEMGIGEIWVIHGHGTGTLKNGLRQYVRRLKKVQGFRPGKRGEGGDGVTVCTLRLE